MFKFEYYNFPTLIITGPNEILQLITNVPQDQDDFEAQCLVVHLAEPGPSDQAEKATNMPQEDVRGLLSNNRDVAASVKNDVSWARSLNDEIAKKCGNVLSNSKTKAAALVKGICKCPCPRRPSRQPVSETFPVKPVNR